MRIAYNEADKTIEIKDDLKKQYFGIFALIVLNLLNALLRLITLMETDLGIVEIIWFAVGTASLVSLYFILFKKSTAEKIKVDEIKRLKQKSVFGRDRYSLVLTNGKRRDLMKFKSQYELAELKGLLAGLGKA